jgi:hypothetical protein
MRDRDLITPRPPRRAVPHFGFILVRAIELSLATSITEARRGRSRPVVAADEVRRRKESP